MKNIKWIDVVVEDSNGVRHLIKVDTIPLVGSVVTFEFDPSPWQDSHQDEWITQEGTVIVVLPS